jgi:hypothetical protein
MANSSDFRCPECGAVYQVEQVSEPADTPSETFNCNHCLHPFPSKEGNFSFKYLLVPLHSDYDSLVWG